MKITPTVKIVKCYQPVAIKQIFFDNSFASLLVNSSFQHSATGSKNNNSEDEEDYFNECDEINENGYTEI